MLKEDPRLSFSDWLVHGVFNMQFPAGRALVHRFTFILWTKPHSGRTGRMSASRSEPSCHSPSNDSHQMVGKKEQDLITPPSPCWENLHICEETKFFLPGGNTNFRKHYGKKAHVGLWQSYTSILLLSHLRSGVLHTKIRWNEVPRPKQ